MKGWFFKCQFPQANTVDGFKVFVKKTGASYLRIPLENMMDFFDLPTTLLLLKFWAYSPWDGGQHQKNESIL